MSVFRKRADRTGLSPKLPRDIVAMMERFGRFEFDPSAGRDDAGAVWSQTQEPLLSFAMADPTGFIVALAEAVLPGGGWSAYGAAHTIANLVSSSHDNDDDAAYHDVMKACLAFLRSNGVPPMRVTGREWNYWIDSGGTADTWIPRLPIPAPSDAPITGLGHGELRKIAQLTAAPDSNAIFVKQEADGTYVALVEARWSDDDPRRSQSDFKKAGSLYDLYIDVALSLQVPPSWSDPELEPYFPLPRPRI